MARARHHTGQIVHRVIMGRDIAGMSQPDPARSRHKRHGIFRLESRKIVGHRNRADIDAVRLRLAELGDDDFER
jgi:hypothetical protein